VLALLPERKGFLHGIFGVLKPGCLDGLADERFLVGARANFRVIKRSIARLRVKLTVIPRSPKYNSSPWAVIQTSLRCQRRSGE
jgi:hypothetical protein